MRCLGREDRGEEKGTQISLLAPLHPVPSCLSSHAGLRARATMAQDPATRYSVQHHPLFPPWRSHNLQLPYLFPYRMICGTSVSSPGAP